MKAGLESDDGAHLRATEIAIKVHCPTCPRKGELPIYL